VVEHLLLDVEQLEPPFGPDPGGEVERVVAGAGTDLEDGLAETGGEDLAEPPAGDQRVRRLDPEPLRVRARGRVPPPPQRRGGDRCERGGEDDPDPAQNPTL